ncbi:MAG: hypothetical protein WBH20_07090 [Oceanisphaera sp.]|uniref:hypothetical protein n=1 Tax=Oceanisphaera sp. TaxID=1929979 RepID=UPI003C70E263
MVYDLMCYCDSDALREQLTDLPRCGDRVRIEEGPFAGLEAVYQETDGDTRAILLLTLLQNATPTSFANDEFSRIPKT